MAVVIVLALLLSACGGGGTGLIQPQQINAPNDVERELIWRVWDAMGEPDYPVWVYRDTWTPGDDGRAWGDVGRGSNAPCPSKHGSELCAWAVTGRGRISVLQMMSGWQRYGRLMSDSMSGMGRGWLRGN